MVKTGGNTKGSKEALVRVVWSQPSIKQHSVQIKDQCSKRCGRSNGHFGPHPRQSSLQRVHLTSASFADLKAWRNRDTVSFHVVPPKDLRRKRKIWSLLKNRCGIRDTSQVFATHVEEGPNEHGFQKDALVPWRYWKTALKTCGVYWRDGFIPAISGVRANDLVQWMRETCRVRVCERVDPGFLTTVEFIHRRVAWNAEDFFWMYEPIHTLALADEFVFVGKKQLEQTKSIRAAPGSKTTNKGLHDRADVLDERETTMQVFFGWHSTECWTGHTRNTIHNGRVSEIHV